MVYSDMEWWKRIRLEVLRGETSKREILRSERIYWKVLKKILLYRNYRLFCCYYGILLIKQNLYFFQRR